MRVTGNLFFRPKTIFRGPTKRVNPKNSGVSKLPKYYVVVTLNLCQEMPEPMQKKSAQSDHPTLRKCPKCGLNLAFFAIVKISQNFGTFWTFSLGRVIGLSSFALSQAS